MDRDNSSRDYNYISSQIANDFNKNLQDGTNVSIEYMDLLKWKGERLENVGFEQAKGNLFEYVEAAKLVRNVANNGFGVYDKPIVTDVPEHMGG